MQLVKTPSNAIANQISTFSRAQFECISNGTNEHFCKKIENILIRIHGKIENHYLHNPYYLSLDGLVTEYHGVYSFVFTTR